MSLRSSSSPTAAVLVKTSRPLVTRDTEALTSLMTGRSEEGGKAEDVGTAMRLTATIDEHASARTASELRTIMH
jgi:hypothetical protein